MLIARINKLTCLAAILCGSTAVFALDNYTCPAPTEIHSTDFTSPSIWIAPPMPRATPNVVGVGLGGKKVKKFIAVHKVNVNGKDGWVCVYKTEGGTSIRDYEIKIRGILAGNKYLIKYLDKVNRIFTEKQPYLKNYPIDEPIGFVGYEEEWQDQQQYPWQQQYRRKK